MIKNKIRAFKKRQKNKENINPEQTHVSKTFD